MGILCLSLVGAAFPASAGGDPADAAEAAYRELLEAARDPSRDFMEAYEAALEAEVSRARLLEARTLNALANGDLEGLLALREKIGERLDEIEVGLDRSFATRRQLRGFHQALEAIVAYREGNYEEFERLATEAFVDAPGFVELFKIARLLAEIRGQEAKRAAMADLVVPMDLEVANVEGEARALREWMGERQALLVDFWASWCGPCIELMPELRAKAEALEGQGVLVAGMNTDKQDQRAKAKRVREERGMEAVPWLLDPEGSVLSDLLLVDSIPRMVLLDREGKVRFNGHPMDEELERALAKLGVELTL